MAVRKYHTLNGINVEWITIQVPRFTCSNGYFTKNVQDANIVEAKRIIGEIFAGVAIKKVNSKTKHHERFLRVFKNFYLEQGVYTVLLRNIDDLIALDIYLRGLEEKLDYPDGFPFEFKLEIYSEYVDAINPHAQWRVFDMKKLRNDDSGNNI